MRRLDERREEYASSCSGEGLMNTAYVVRVHRYALFTSCPRLQRRQATQCNLTLASATAREISLPISRPHCAVAT